VLGPISKQRLNCNRFVDASSRVTNKPPANIKTPGQIGAFPENRTLCPTSKYFQKIPTRMPHCAPQPMAVQSLPSDNHRGVPSVRRPEKVPLASFDRSVTRALESALRPRGPIPSVRQSRMPPFLPPCANHAGIANETFGSAQSGIDIFSLQTTIVLSHL
jgi:hypothetical protein